MCSKLTKKTPRTTSTVSLFLTLSLTLRILVSLLLTLNIFHILRNVKNAEIRALYWKKEIYIKKRNLHIQYTSDAFLQWVIPEINQTGGGGGLRTYLFESPPGIFRFFTLPLQIPDKKKVSVLETPQNCVTPL